MTRSVAIVFTLLFLMVNSVSADGGIISNAVPITNISTNDRTMIWLPAGISFGIFTVPIVESLYTNNPGLTGIFYMSAFALEPAPLYFLDWGKGLAFSLIQLALGGMIVLENACFGNSQVYGFLLQNLVDTGLYSAYETYKAARLSNSAVSSGRDWRHWDFLELFLAPLDLKNLLHPVNLIPAAACALNFILYPPVLSNSVFSTGKYYYGNWELPAYAGAPLQFAGNLLEYAMVGVAEEAVFRGFLYEELKGSAGPVWSRVVDSSVFALLHVPMGVVAGASLQDQLIGFTFRLAAGLYLEWAYDMGGLPLAVTAHLLTDFLIVTLSAFFHNGVPAATTAAIRPEAVMPPVQVTIPVYF